MLGTVFNYWTPLFENRLKVRDAAQLVEALDVLVHAWVILSCVVNSWSAWAT